MVYVFVGSRIAKLSDGEQRKHMDTRRNTHHRILLVLIRGLQKPRFSTVF
jgi:hypothetical protein